MVEAVQEPMFARDPGQPYDDDDGAHMDGRTADGRRRRRNDDGMDDGTDGRTEDDDGDDDGIRRDGRTEDGRRRRDGRQDGRTDRGRRRRRRDGHDGTD